MLSKARGCNALATSLEMQQIRDAPLVMHQDHSESLGLHVAQRINCYKLPRKLPQIRSAQQEQHAARTGLAGVRMGRPLGNIIYIMRNNVSGGRSLRWLCMAMAEALAWLLPPLTGQLNLYFCAK